MLGILDAITGWVVVVLVTGAALYLLVQIQRDLRRQRAFRRDDEGQSGLLDLFRRVPARARLGILAAAMLTAAALQLAALERPEPPAAAADETAALLPVSDPAPAGTARAPQGLDTITVVGLAALVVIIGLGAPFWFDGLGRLLRGRPESAPSEPQTPPTLRDPATDLDEAA